MLSTHPAERKPTVSEGSKIAVVQKTEVDSDLIERAKSDPDAFGELYELYYGRILNYVYRRIPDIATAKELTSNSFFNVLKALPKYQKKNHIQCMDIPNCHQ